MLDGLQNYAGRKVGGGDVKGVCPLDSPLEFVGGLVGGVHDSM